MDRISSRHGVPRFQDKTLGHWKMKIQKLHPKNSLHFCPDIAWPSAVACERFHGIRIKWSDSTDIKNYLYIFHICAFSNVYSYLGNCILPAFLYSTLIMAAKVTETCSWIYTMGHILSVCLYWFTTISVNNKHVYIKKNFFHLITFQYNELLYWRHNYSFYNKLNLLHKIALQTTNAEKKSKLIQQ